MVTLAALRIWTPLVPDPCPSMSSPCSRTSEFAAVLMVMPFSPPVASTPAVPVEGQLIVTDLVIVTAPKPPGSRQLISPPSAVCEKAPAKVLHGAVRLHGLKSSPTAETQVRLACAAAGSMCDNAKSDIARIESRLCFMGASQAARVVDTTRNSYAARRRLVLDRAAHPIGLDDTPTGSCSSDGRWVSQRNQACADCVNLSALLDPTYGLI